MRNPLALFAVTAVLIFGCIGGGGGGTPTPAATGTPGRTPTPVGGATATPGAGATGTPAGGFHSSLSQFHVTDYDVWCAGNKFYVFNDDRQGRQIKVEAGLPLIYSTGTEQTVVATIPSEMVIDSGEVGRVQISGDCSRYETGGLKMLSLLYEGTMAGVSQRAPVAKANPPGGLEGNLRMDSFDINCSGDTLRLHKYFTGPIQSPRYGYWIEPGLEVRDRNTNQTAALVAEDKYFPADQEDLTVRLDRSIPATAGHYYGLVHPQGGKGGYRVFRCG